MPYLDNFDCDTCVHNDCSILKICSEIDNLKDKGNKILNAKNREANT